MNPQPAKCKFCQRELVLMCDPSYDLAGDVHKLLAMAACNRCADLRIRKRKLETRIELAAQKFKQATMDREPDLCSALRVKLTELTTHYCNLIAEWLGATSAYWDREIVELICDKPDHWPAVLKQCWSLYEDKAA